MRCSEALAGGQGGSVVVAKPTFARRFAQGGLMNVCEVCGNDYDKPIEVVRDGESHFFDCFECAIHALAPVCEHCGCKIIGHGVEAGGVFYCCAHCASKEGVSAVQDRV
jgi:hypothetical protein